MAKEWLQGSFSTTEESKGGVGAGWLLLRFTMIFFICYFNSEMVRVVMFKPEIVAEIKIRQNAQTGAISDSLQLVKETINDRIIAKENAVTKAQEGLAFLIEGYDNHLRAIDDSLEFWTSKLVYEVKGPGGITGKRGDGFVAKTIRETILRYQEQKAQLTEERKNAASESVQASTVQINQEELDSARVRAKSQLAMVDVVEGKLIRQVMDRPVNGLAFMLEVLNDIAGRNMIIWAVFFMFFFIEAIPVLLKFFSTNDSFVDARAHEIMNNLKISNEKARKTFEDIQAFNKSRNT